MSRVSPQDFSLLQGGVSTFHGVDQPRSSAHADFLAAKTESRQRHEESLVVLGLLEAATAKLESRMESFLAEIRSPTQDHAMAPAEVTWPLSDRKTLSPKPFLGESSRLNPKSATPPPNRVCPYHTVATNPRNPKPETP